MLDIAKFNLLAKLAGGPGQAAAAPLLQGMPPPLLQQLATAAGGAGAPGLAEPHAKSPPPTPPAPAAAKLWLVPERQQGKLQDGTRVWVEPGMVVEDDRRPARGIVCVHPAGGGQQVWLRLEQLRPPIGSPPPSA